MALTDRKLFVEYAPQIDGVMLASVESPEPNQQVRQIEHVCAGEQGPIDFSIASEEPQFSFQTPDLGILLGLSSTILENGYAGTNNNTVIQWRSNAAIGGLNAITATSHITATSPWCFVEIRSLKVEQDAQKPAMADVLVHLLSDGTTEPNVIDIATALTARATLGDQFAMGNLLIAGTNLGGPKSLEYKSQSEARPTRAGGDTIAESCVNRIRKPQIIVNAENTELLNTYGFGMSKITGNVDMFVRHIAATGGRTAKTGVGNEKHIRIRMVNPVLVIEKTKPAGNSDETQVIATFQHREGNALSVAVDQEIT